LTTVLAVAFVAVLLAGCANKDPAPAATGLDKRTISAGEVEVTLTPTRIDAAGGVFDVVLDSHSVDLDLDIAQNAALTVGGETWTDPTWAGSAPGGHHREGTLTFTATGPLRGNAELTIDGLDGPVAPRWALPRGT
jgi:hypothetical protein